MRKFRPILHQQDNFIFSIFMPDCGNRPHVLVTSTENKRGRAKIWLDDLTFENASWYELLEFGCISEIVEERKDELIRAYEKATSLPMEPIDHSVPINARIERVFFIGGWMSLLLEDQREITCPLKWFDNVLAISKDERYEYELSEDRQTIVWADIGEAINVAEILRLKPSYDNEAKCQKPEEEKPTSERSK